MGWAEQQSASEQHARFFAFSGIYQQGKNTSTNFVAITGEDTV
jgi:hypothetical protein